MKPFLFVCILSCLSFISVGQIESWQVRVTQPELAAYVEPNPKIFIAFFDLYHMCPLEGDTLSSLKVSVYVGARKIPLETRNGGRNFVNDDEPLPDSFRIVVENPFFEKVDFMYYKKLFFRRISGMTIHLIPKRLQVNRIICIGDDIEVRVNGEKHNYDASRLRQSKKESLLRTIGRIPGIEVGEGQILLDGQRILHLFINGKWYRCRNNHQNLPGWNYNVDIFKEMKQDK